MLRPRPTSPRPSPTSPTAAAGMKPQSQSAPRETCRHVVGHSPSEDAVGDRAVVAMVVLVTAGMGVVVIGSITTSGRVAGRSPTPVPGHLNFLFLDDRRPISHWRRRMDRRVQSRQTQLFTSQAPERRSITSRRPDKLHLGAMATSVTHNMAMRRSHQDPESWARVARRSSHSGRRHAGGDRQRQATTTRHPRPIHRHINTSGCRRLADRRGRAARFHPAHQLPTKRCYRQPSTGRRWRPADRCGPPMGSLGRGRGYRLIEYIAAASPAPPRCRPAAPATYRVVACRQPS